jgi:Protein of unknown function (DUF3098)
MSKPLQQPKKSTSNPAPSSQQMPSRTPAAPTRTAKTDAPRFNMGSNELIFGKENFKWMGIGLGLIALGLILMAGGAQPDPMKWDPTIIYNPRRITVAPILMIAGFIMQIYAIFKRSTPANNDIKV